MTSKPRRFVLLLPLACLLISAALVGQQYYRRAALTREMASADREFDTLKRKIPQGDRARLHEHNHDEGHADSEPPK